MPSLFESKLLPYAANRTYMSQAETITRTIAGTLSQLRGGESMSRLVADSGLIGLLDSADPQTLLVPNDQALTACPTTNPELVLRNHLIRGRFSSQDLREVKEIQTESGLTIKPCLENGELRLGLAGLVATDIECSNGLIHVIDCVL